MWAPRETSVAELSREEDEEGTVQMHLSNGLPIDPSVSQLPGTPWPHDLPQIPLSSCHSRLPAPTRGALLQTQPHSQGSTGSHTCSLAGLGVDFSHFFHSFIHVTNI